MSARAPRRVDAHQHFWSLARGDYGWLTPALAPIHRDFGAADLAPLLRDADVGATVLVQAAPTVDETRFLLDIARATAFVAGVVGWVDLAAPGAAARIESLSVDPKLKGLRPMLQDLPDPRWIAEAPIGAAVDAMQACGLRLDALVRAEHLQPLLSFARRYPALPIVIDHLAKPRPDRSDFEGWQRGMRELAAREQTYCKLSGLATEFGSGWSADSLRPWVDSVLEAFGPARILWGSDWPVLLLAGDYRGWIDAATRLVGGLAESERESIWGGAARRFYGLGEPSEWTLDAAR
ncbi:MAG TPA: amidohydrolase family protein [Burkholderiaceae bacterium]|nr:amidohydrolase family protein [Burkholderiaceae bacterium]